MNSSFCLATSLAGLVSGAFGLAGVAGSTLVASHNFYTSDRFDVGD